jgi:hypothetical protein
VESCPKFETNQSPSLSSGVFFHPQRSSKLGFSYEKKPHLPMQGFALSAVPSRSFGEARSSEIDFVDLEDGSSIISINACGIEHQKAVNQSHLISKGFSVQLGRQFKSDKRLNV